MGHKSSPRRSNGLALRVNRLLGVAAGITLSGNWVAANALTWDASGTSASSPADGSGRWDTSSRLWSDGSNDNPWVNANNDTAVFGNGGAPGNVSLGDNITVGGLAFDSSYSINSSESLDAGFYQLTINNGAITLSNNASATISNTLSGSASVSGAGTLTLTGNVDNSGLSLTVSNGATVVLAKNSNPNVHAIGGDGLTINGGGTVRLAGTGGGQIFGGSPVNINSGGLLDLNGSNQTISHLSGTGGILLNSAVSTISTLTFAGAGGDYFGRIEDNAGTGGIVALAVSNGGSQKLESANSYGGGTIIGNGTLILNLCNSLGTGPVTLGTGSDDATLIGNGTAEFTAPIPNAINVNGTGANIVSANGWDPTFSGAVTLNNTDITLQSNNPLRSNLNITGGITGPGNVTIAVLANGNSQVNISGTSVNNAGTITNNGTSGTATISAVIGSNVTGVIQNSSSCNLILSGANTYAAASTLSSGTLDLANQNAVQNSTLNMAGGTLVLDSAVTANAFTFGGLAASSSGGGYDIPLRNSASDPVTLTVGGNNASTTYAGAFSAAGSLNKIGGGRLTLTGGSDYTGSTTIAGGTLVIQNASSLFNNNNGNTLAEAISIAGGAALELDETNSSGQWALGTTGGVTITGNGTLQLNQTGSGASAGLIALGDQGGGRNVNLNMTGGMIDIEGGTLRNGGNAGGIWAGNKAAMNIASGATLDLWDGNDVIVDALSGNGTVTHTSFGSNSNLTVGVNNNINGPAIFTGTIAETSGHSISVTKDGTGIQVFAGVNNYSGGTTVNGGTLIFVNDITGIPNFTDNAKLDFDVTIGTQQLAGGTLSGNGILEITGGGTVLLGANDATENISLAGGLIQVSGSGTLLRNEFGNGNWEGNSASLEIDSGATVDTWDSSGGITVDALNGNGTIAHTSFGSAENLTIGVANGSGTFTGTISDVPGHALSLVKVGNGTEVLTGANAYSNATSINGGTLRVNNSGGSGTGSGAVVVNSGGTLGGNGSIGSASAMDGAITVNSGGTITAGPDSNTPGLLTSFSTSGVTLNGGSTYRWKINNGAGAGGTSSGWDEIATQGISFESLSSGNPFRVYITGSPTGLTVGSARYTIAANPAGSISIDGNTYGNDTVLTSGETSSYFVLNTDGFFDVNSPVFGSSVFQLELVADGSGQDLALIYTATPEPGPALLVLGGTAPLLRLRRRKPRAS